MAADYAEVMARAFTAKVAHPADVGRARRGSSATSAVLRWGGSAFGRGRTTPSWSVTDHEAVDQPERSHDDFMFFGSRSLYEKAGFTEVVRRSPTRVVMRRRLRPGRARPT